MNARPDDHPYDGHVPADEVNDDVPWAHDPGASTWVPPESPDIGTRPAWLPPSTQPGQPYGATSPGWPQPPYDPYAQDPYAQVPYGQPPYGQPYGAPPPYGAPGYRKPRMPRWAKIVLVAGVALYGIDLIVQVFSVLVRSR